jgi:hypothetical protein
MRSLDGTAQRHVRQHRAESLNKGCWAESTEGSGFLLFWIAALAGQSRPFGSGGV